MKPRAKSIVLLCTVCTVSSALAFGPSFEPLFNAQSCTPGYFKQLHASNSEDDEIKGSCPSDFDFVAADFDSIDKFSSLLGGFDGTFPLLQKQADTMALETFDSWDDCGEDCRECEIPQDWCVPEKTINVMEYLGVTRVKPLC